ncbi:MAG: DNA gyrase subunit A [Euryarchaeota archaeon]|nr:DNA gyrase subunit A [Euryarchaeota archaeon]
MRVGFEEHFQIHAAHAKETWKDPAFRAAQRRGVKAYYENHPEARESSRAKLVAHNKDPAFRAANGPKVSRALLKRYENAAERAKLSARARANWSNQDFRSRMIQALTAPPKRPLTPEQKERVRAIISAKSRAMWSDPAKRESVLQALRAATQTDEFRLTSSRRMRAPWQTASYRSKYAPDHHRRMSLALWAKPATRTLQAEKMRRQQADPDFKAKMRAASARNARALIAAKPDVMRQMAARAAAALAKKWQTVEHRRAVMRQKIARYGNQLLRSLAGAVINADVFDGRRPGNWVPRYAKAMQYFSGHEEFLKAARNYNHRVVSVTALAATADVYDLTVDGHHNFLLAAGVFVHNSVDGDPPGAQRYTEAKLSPIAMEMLTDIDKETVDLVPNFDASLTEPVVLPSALPNLLVNGSSGIAVGMATNMAPHNLGEVVDAGLHLIDHPEASINDLIQVVRGPDFPTGGIIMGRQGLVEAYATGRGRVVVRGRFTEEKVRERNALVFTELPYMVNKANLLVSIAELVKDKRIEGISDLRDESSREGIRVIVELKKDANTDVVVNQLFAHTQLQTTFSILNLALVKNRPVVLSLKRLLEEWLEHRVQIVTRRTQFDLRKAEERAHVVEGLLIALEHIDAVVKLIKESATVEAARTGLIAKYGLTDVQAKAILDLRLAKLAQLEVKTLQDEHRDLAKRIARYKEILGSRAEVLTIIKDELRELKKTFGDARRTQITGEEAEEIVLEELIPVHDVVVTMTNAGYVKRSPLAAYRAQGRGGKGIIGTDTTEEDFVTDLFVTSSHNHIMFFTSRGQVHWKKAYELPEGTRYGRGKAVVNLLQGLQQGERVTAAIPVAQFDDDHFVFFATKKGIVKRVALSEFKNVRAGGIRAIGLEENDLLIGVVLTKGGQEIVLAKKDGLAIRFKEDDVRPMGRTAVGVWGTRMGPEDEVVALAVTDGKGDILTIKANGRGKRTAIEEYRLTGRGGQGVITINVDESVDGKTVTSPVVGMVHVSAGEEIIVSTERGIVIRVPIDEIPQKGRAAQGNWIIRPEDGDRVVAVAKVAAENLPPPRAGQ